MGAVDQITLASVACTKVLETIVAIKKCQAQMKFSRVVLLTNEEVEPGGIEVIKIPKLDYWGYNEFVAMSLWRHIPTDYCLLVQNDGYVINGSKWDDGFLDFDFIGAGWPIPNDDKTYRTPNGQLVRVGNGGFSFRSNKLLRAPSALGLEFGDFGTGFPHEDGAICVHWREKLEKYGIKYAPLEVAVRFSRELPIPELKDGNTFGFHKYL